MRPVIVLSALAALALPVPAPAHWGGGAELSVDLPDHGMLASCGEVRFTAKRGELATGEERVTLARPSTGAIRLEAGGHGGVHARGEARNDLEVLVCKAATAGTAEEARTRLQQVKAVVDGAKVRLEGPEGDGWAAHAFVRAPRDGALELDVKNGPVAVEETAGTLDVEAANGPVDLAKVGGTVSIDATNGPVSLSNASGRVRLRAQNGPVEIELAGRTWSGEGLSVEMANGPLDLTLDPAYASGVRVESHSGPFACDLSPCGRIVRDGGLGEGRTVELGSGPSKVTIAARNGPVAIRAR